MSDSLEDFIYLNIKYLREAKKRWSKKELADVLGKQPATIGDYEKGKAKPSIPVLIQLSKIFEVSIDDLILRDIENTGYSINEPEESNALLKEQVMIYRHMLKKQDPDFAAMWDKLEKEGKVGE